MLKTGARNILPGMALLSLLLLVAVAFAGCSGPGFLQLIQQPLDGQVVTTTAKTAVSDNTAIRPAPAENVIPPAAPAGSILPEPGPPVRIALIHYRGTLQPLGCCNPGLYETDEFVVIQNFSDRPQDIRGWRLVNITRDYLSFTFPEYFPCIPLNTPGMTPHGDMTPKPLQLPTQYGEFPSPAYIEPKSVEERMSFIVEDIEILGKKAPEKIDWSACGAMEPLDQTRMAPQPGQDGQPAYCVLYPGQSVLVFTDEIHCKYGGFSFNWGAGNIWSNSSPDTAVLYNAKGEEVSRRSYQVK